MESENFMNVVGEYMHPVITPDTKNDDPWQRNYNQPPPLNHLVPRKYPLIDLRPLLSEPDYSPTNLLKSHGFGVVKHQSAFLDGLEGDAAQQSLADQTLVEVYYPEIEQLVRENTGAKKVIVIASALRQGKSVPQAYKLPTKVGEAKDAVAQDRSNQPDGKAAAPHKLAGQKSLGLAAPVRVPHMDFTPLGARQTIRSQSREILDEAQRAGVIAHEDAICNETQFKASTKEAESIINDRYNQSNQLGPRYAAFSIWRPLKKVQRDPITLASRRREDARLPGEFVHWRYMNKARGTAELGGDFLKEYAMLGVAGEEPAANDLDALKWYYVSGQEPDQVLFIKLFDSASLGPGAEHAGAPWHASPEIGAVEGSEPRESIDVRVLAFW